jgi:hypothetical protein
MQIENFPNQPSELGQFVLDSSTLDYTNTGTLQKIIEAYPYGQFSDDPDIQAFFAGLNTTAQGYLSWFTQNPLSVYTLGNINGALLDWVGEGVYGIERPVISSVASKVTGAYDTKTYDASPYGVRKVTSYGSVAIVNDDIYKRVLTWHLYLGDGRQMSVQWLRRRIARFIYGTNGTDIPADDFQKIWIQRSPAARSGSFVTGPYNTQAYDTSSSTKRLTRHSMQIGLHTGQISQVFNQLLSQGDLAVPFQIKFNVIFSDNFAFLKQ